MAWYRGVDCKNCNGTIALKKLSGPEEGPLDHSGSTGWAGARIACPHCGQEKWYVREDFKVFETMDPIAGDPSEKAPNTKPN
jgi:DNA-directed RNA polymerase subunit RPC12/RpoP